MCITEVCCDLYFGQDFGADFSFARCMRIVALSWAVVMSSLSSTTGLSLVLLVSGSVSFAYCISFPLFLLWWEVQWHHA